MARGKKKESALTPEEKLMQALVLAEEQPYQVPENWCWVYLFKGAAECMDSFRKPINATERAEREGDIPYYGATGQVGWIDDFLTDEELVLLGEDGAPFLDPIKDKAYLINGRAWVNNHAHILRSYFGSVGNQYLVNYLNTFNYKGYVNGTTRLKLTQASMDIMPVPIPPLAEQQRIVDRIEYLFAKLDEAKEKAQSVLDSFETRKAAILHKAFTGELTAKWSADRDFSASAQLKNTAAYPYNIPCGWNAVILGELVQIRRGASPRPIKAFITDSPDGINWIKIGDADGGKYITTIKERVTPSGAQKSVYVEKGTLLLSNSMSFGHPYILDVDGCIHDGWLAILPSVHFDKEFLYYALLFSSWYFEQVAVGTAVRNLNSERVAGTPLPICSIEEQKEIVRILDDLYEKEQQAKEAAETVLEKIDLLKKSILARAFRGELGTNDPAEESALSLLRAIL